MFYLKMLAISCALIILTFLFVVFMMCKDNENNLSDIPICHQLFCDED